MTRRILSALIPILIGASAGGQCDRWERVPGLELPGTNGPIADLTTWDPDGAGPEPELLIAGGSFTAAGSVLARNVCMWDGAEFRAMGAGIAGEVNGVCAVGTQLYAAAYANGVSRVYAWDGAEWGALTGEFRCTLDCAPRPITGLASVNGVLWAAGSVTEISGAPAARIVSWDGAAWREEWPGYGVAVRRVRTNGARTFFDTCERVGNSWNCPRTCDSVNTFVSVSPFGTGAAWLTYRRTLTQTTWSVCGAISGGTVNMRPDEIATTASEAVVFGAYEDPSNLNLRLRGLALVVQPGAASELLQFGKLSGVDAVRFRGELVIAGDFIDVNGAPARCIAIKRGSAWESLNRAKFTAAQAVATLAGEVIAINSRPRASGVDTITGEVASLRWRAGDWQAAGDLFGECLTPTGVVQRTREWQGRLLATTAVRGSASSGYSFCFAHDGAAWNTIGVFPASVRWSSLVDFAGEVWFDQTSSRGVAFNGTSYRTLTAEEDAGIPLVVWNGELYGVTGSGWSRLNALHQWEVLSAFAGNERVDLAIVHNGEIVAAGFFRDPAGNLYGGVAAWTGASWRRLGDPLMSSLETFRHISTLSAHRGDLYVGGTFDRTVNGVRLRYMARYDAAANGGIWRPVDGLNGYAWQLLDAGDALWVCGDFTAAGDVGAAGLAKFVTNPCAADLDCSGGVDSDDTIQFFAWWEVSDSRADVNRDGGVDSDDTIAFFERWEAGC